MSMHRRTARAWCEAGTMPGLRGAGEAPRWERCVDHAGDELVDFAERYFGEAHRKVLLLGGAGFDPRTCNVAAMLACILGTRLHGVFVREHRSAGGVGPHSARADSNAEILRASLAEARFIDLPVFAEDGAITLGRKIAWEGAALDLQPYTDVVVDPSALSLGASFPLIRTLFNRIDQDHLSVNLHVMVTASPGTDGQIRPIPAERITTVHGFGGGLGREGDAPGSLLWMPQLGTGYEGILVRIHDWLRPDDIVPVLPFPADDPRQGDRLIDQFADRFQGAGPFPGGWEIDGRSVVYADERNPLDYYRTVLRLHDRRTPVFASSGGSLLVLTPVGSKVLAIGALMAAMERDLPVVHIEAEGYDPQQALAMAYAASDIVHVWLQGEAYPPIRAAEPTDPAST